LIGIIFFSNSKTASLILIQKKKNVAHVVWFKEAASKKPNPVKKSLKLLWTVTLVNQGDSTCTFIQLLCHTIPNGNREK